MALSSKDFKTYSDLKDKAVKDFITELGFLVHALYTKNTNDDNFIFIKDGFNVAKNENPEVVVMVSGPYVWKYRTQLENGDVQTMLNNDYKDEVEGAKEYLEGHGKFDQIKEILKKIKETWPTFSKIEQETVAKKMQKLVVHYASFLGASKKLNKTS